MTYFPVQPRYSVYIDSLGDPLDDGYIYLGKANLDPTVYPAKASWDEAGLYPITFPVRTMNGYPLRDGIPAQMYLNFADNTEYSVLINDEDGVEVYSSTTGLIGYFPSGDGGDAATLEGHPASYFAVDSLVAKLAATQTFTGTNTFDETVNITNAVATNLGISITRNSINVATLIGSFDGLYLNGSQIISFSTGGTERGQFTAAGDLRAYGQLTVGANTAGDSVINLYDLNSATYRTLRWSNTNNDWYVEDNNSVDQQLYHTGNDSTLAHLAGAETFTGNKTFSGSSNFSGSSYFYTDIFHYFGAGSTNFLRFGHVSSTGTAQFVPYVANVAQPTKSLQFNGTSQEWQIDSTNQYAIYHEGTSSASDTFTTSDAKTVTVVNGLITSIV